MDKCPKEKNKKKREKRRREERKKEKGWLTILGNIFEFQKRDKDEHSKIRIISFHQISTIFHTHAHIDLIV